jgi:hypothetical protein
MITNNQPVKELDHKIQLFFYTPALRYGFMINFWPLKQDDEHKL